MYRGGVNNTMRTSVYYGVIAKATNRMGASVSRENHAVGGGGGDNDSRLVERPLKRLKVSSSLLFVEGSDSENQTTSIELPPGKICWFVGGYIVLVHIS